jgi:hypothetical protein
MLQKVAQIVSAIDIPVSVDLESGYADTPAASSNVREVAGIVAFNLEDSDGIPGAGLRPTEEHAERSGPAAVRRGSGRRAQALRQRPPDGFWNHDEIAQSKRTSNPAAASISGRRRRHLRFR